MIIPKFGDIIKHKNFKDVAFFVKKRYGPYNGRYKIKGEWINQGFYETFTLYITQKFDIKVGDLCDWLICVEPEKQCIRYSKWVSLSKEK